jgi:hypothetical protein
MRLEPMLYVCSMEDRHHRPATRFGDTARHGIATGSATGSAIGSSGSSRRFESPTMQTISLCCEISAYAPDGDDWPLV